MLNFEYEKGIKEDEKAIFKNLEILANNIPDITIHKLMEYLEVYKDHRDFAKYRIGSGGKHVFICRLNKANDRLVLITNENEN